MLREGARRDRERIESKIMCGVDVTEDLFLEEIQHLIFSRLPLVPLIMMVVKVVHLNHI
jgi:hypothetical protein